MLSEVEPCGVLINECSIEGETRAEDIYPGHPNGTQAGRDTFLLVYATRGFRGTDDDISTVFQLRRGSYDGPVIKEGVLGKTTTDWEPLEDGVKYSRVCGSPAVFGVPRGAIVDGERAPNENLFVVRWRQQARVLDLETGLLKHVADTSVNLHLAIDAVIWTQVRLNEAEDDIEIVQPPRMMRQKGFSSGVAICEAGPSTMTHGGPAVPFGDDATQWIELAWFTTVLPAPYKGLGLFGRQTASSIASILYEFNPDLGLYEWTRTGAMTGPCYFEGNILRYQDEWLINARVKSAEDHRNPCPDDARGVPIPWWRTRDPFAPLGEPTWPEQPCTAAPIHAFECADGLPRVVTTDTAESTTLHCREPLHCITVDPEQDFKMVQRDVVFDVFAAGLPIRRESIPSIDMGKIMPHSGGKTGYLLHRTRPTSTKDPKRTGHVVNQAEMDVSAIYYAKLHYDREYPGMWKFEASE